MMKTTNNKRKHERYTAPKGAILLYNDEITQIFNLSEGGVCTKVLSRSETLSKVGTSCYCRSTIAEFDGLPIRIARSNSIKSKGVSNVKQLITGIEFVGLAPRQQEKIQKLLSQLS